MPAGPYSMHKCVYIYDCNQPNSSVTHGCGQPPLELLVPHEGPARSCCRYICRRSCITPSPETTDDSPAAGARKSVPPSCRATPETAKNAKITRIIVTCTEAITLLAAIALMNFLISITCSTVATSIHSS